MHGVGQPNGHLEQIYLEASSVQGLHEHGYYSECLFWEFVPFQYRNDCGDLAIDYYKLPDDTSRVPSWSNVDIVPPRESAIKAWYQYFPDMGPDYPFSVDGDNRCDGCVDGDDCHDCFNTKPKRLRLDLSKEPYEDDQ